MNVTQPRQLKRPLRSAIAPAIKELIWHYAIRFDPTKPPIGVYGSRRSGSSLLMEVICANPGIVFIDQPFGVYTASSSSLNRLPIFPYGQIAFPDPDEEALLHDYVAGLLGGQIRTNYPWKFWQREFHFRNDRICLKITDAKAMIDWLANEFRLETVVLTRHPIAQRYRWPTWVGIPPERDSCGTKDMSSIGWMFNSRRTVGIGTGTAQNLSGEYLTGLENLPMLRLLPSRLDWLFVSYEDLMLQTEQVIDCLAQHLELPAKDGMMARVGRPAAGAS